MFKRYAAALTALSLLVAIPARADYVIKDGAATSQTFGSFTLSGVQFPKHAMVDPATGLAIGTSGAPFFATIVGTPSVDTVVRSTSVNRGGTLTTASTAVTLVPANASRRGLIIQNRNAPTGTYSAATSVFMNCLTTATSDFNSLEIPAGALYDTPVYVREF